MHASQEAHHIGILSLNCQHGRQPKLADFLANIYKTQAYDFLLLQEVNDVVASMIESSGVYKLLAMPQESRSNFRGGVTIAHHTSHYPKSTEYFLLNKEVFNRTSETHYGYAVGDFEGPKGQFTIASLHLHAGLFSMWRRKEILFIEESLKNRQRQGSTIIGGDFNSGYPWELKNFDSILGSFLVNATTEVRATIDSLYSEPALNPVNNLSWLLAKIGLHVRAKVDHVYADQSLIARKSCSRTLPDRVSDHSPLEVIFEGV